MHTRQPSVRPTPASALAAALITALTAGLSVPCISANLYDAAKTRSMNNLRALAGATRAYTEDWDGDFPGWQHNPGGKFAHNVWDQQISGNLRSKDVYNNGNLGIRSWADPRKQRVVTYGLNGLLICTPSSFNGSTRSQMTANEAPNNPPAPLSLSTVTDPEDTILFAELATEAAVSLAFTTWNKPYVANQAATGSEQWNSAMDHWIDISPREFVENATPTTGSYDPTTWKTSSGVARNMYGDGGNYAFVDGHVEFQTLGETVGLGKTFTQADGTESPPIAPGNDGAWKPLNIHNRWNPRR